MPKFIEFYNITTYKNSYSGVYANDWNEYCEKKWSSVVL